MITTDNQLTSSQATIAALNLAFQSAQNKSRRGAIGWAILNSKGSILSHGSIMAGIETQRPAFSVAKHKREIRQLILTAEPSPGFFDSALLTEQIDDSSCTTVTTAHRFSDDIVDPNWRKWTEIGHKKINYLQSSDISSHLVSGILRIRHAYRPWVTVVSAASLDNQHIPLSDQAKEFGFTVFLSELASQNRTHILEKSHRDIHSLLPETNNMDESIDIFEVGDVSTVKTLLRYSAQEKRCNAIIFCQPDFLVKLAAEDLVDEIIHHISLKDSTKTAEHQNNPGTLNFKNWKPISSNIMGNCVQIHFKKRIDTLPA